MRSEILIETPRPDRGIFIGSTPHRYWRDPEPVTPRLSQDGAREFDAYLGCWVLVAEPVLPGKTPAESVTPVWDGSGKLWTVVADGQAMWVIEAADFDRALVEKRRLCQAVGGKSGWARLEEGVR